MEKLKHFIRDHKAVMNILAALYRLIGFNHVHGRQGLKISWRGVFARHTSIKNYGKNNKVYIGKGCRLKNCTIQLFGDNNNVLIENDCVGNELDIWSSTGGKITVEHNTHFTGKIHIACIEGKAVRVGARCLFSNDIVIRTGDSHSILSLTGERINPAKDVVIGNHVWVGQKVIILKGSQIGDESIVGTGAIVTGKQFEDNVILANIPAKIVKQDVTWHHNLL